MLGAIERVDVLDDVLRGLRVTSAEVLDRIDRPRLPVGARSPDAELRTDVQRTLEQVSTAIHAELDQLRAEHELTRLASLASLEGSTLTPRQREVLELLASGLDPVQVADELHVSEKTVAQHIRALRAALVRTP